MLSNVSLKNSESSQIGKENFLNALLIRINSIGTIMAIRSAMKILNTFLHYTKIANDNVHRHWLMKNKTSNVICINIISTNIVKKKHLVLIIF